MCDASLLANLPGEIHLKILSYLSPMDRICLKVTSTYFNNVIPKLSPEELQDAELSTSAETKDLYGCYDCLRLRSVDRFADPQLRKKRGRFGRESMKRFCVECGLADCEGRNPRVRYVRGNHIDIQGVPYIICENCNRFGLKANEDDHTSTKLCVTCWRPRYERRMQEEESTRRAEREQRRATRRAQMRSLGYSSSDWEDSCPPSPTWSEEQMAMIQSEADMYMNSPKASD
ncbi:uncharacterized protein F5Z01DRAFT_631659 [Emericellopsis atlantica]|uniref:F-box domain-containing protein n=1 Tax=Emericellopsis atlantica TaxID=2614577 RepID=A0A9P7ZDI3_9HYPO|nr:uncharacterized protein F5Z01DRAFT_631659 [Emericellopsis atlantica]KAG9249468.1 hypothetical protein F5Z01DRAFT_631659 [Emericellopsis atlantica]